MNDDINYTNEIIGFFGASVTAQKNGYAKEIIKLFGIKEYIYGYGGCHLNDAGIIYIDEVLKVKPTICFFEWFSTGYTNFNKYTINILDTIIYKFSKNDCKLVFLFLPKKDLDIEWHNKTKKYLDDKGLIYIDVNEKVKYSELICKDTVHTTDYGANLYANYIAEIFKSIYNKLEIPKNINVTDLANIQKLVINKKFNKYIKLKGDCVIFTCNCIIGPNSGYISIGEKEILLWDQYCHYDRGTCCIKNITVDETLEFKILQKEVDHSSCRREYDFSNIVYELNIKEIYYLGNNLEFLGGL